MRELSVNPLDESAAPLAEPEQRECVGEDVRGLHEQRVRVEDALEVEREAALEDHFGGARFVREELRLDRQRSHTHACSSSVKSSHSSH